MPFKIMIIEDDLIIAENLKENLIELSYQVVGVATNFSEAVELYNTNSPDICITDIYLKGSSKNGIEIMDHLQVGENIPIIYLTSFDDMEFRAKAKATNPSAYLMKPASKTQIDITIDFALTRFQKQKNQLDQFEEHSSCPFLTTEDYFFVRVKGRYEKIAVNEISYVAAAGSYCKINTGDKEYVISTGLKSLLEQLETNKLVRCHRSYAVNLSKVKAFDDVSLFMICGNNVNDIPLGNNYKNTIQSLLPKIKSD